MVLAPLAKASPVDTTRAFEPGGIEEGHRLASLLVKSGLLPDTVRTPEAAFAIIATGRELGLTAMQSLRSIHVIKGKTILSADLVAALVKSRRDVCMYFQLVESTPDIARYKTHRVGEPEPTSMAFTFEDAKRAGVTGNDNWRKYPAAMLRARCITALARAVYPDLAMGVYDADEFSEAPAPLPHPVPLVQDLSRREPDPPTKPASSGPRFQFFCESVDSAESGTSLNAIARSVQRAHAGGDISDEEFERIKSAVKAKRALVDAKPAETETREPGEEG